MYRFLLVILLGVTLLTGGCGGGDSNRQAPFMVNADGVSTFDLNQLRSQLNTFPIGSLTALEEEGLLVVTATAPDRQVRLLGPGLRHEEAPRAPQLASRLR